MTITPGKHDATRESGIRPLFCKSFAEFVHGTARAALEHCTARQRGSRCDTGVAFAAGHERGRNANGRIKPVPFDSLNNILVLQVHKDFLLSRFMWFRLV